MTKLKSRFTRQVYERNAVVYKVLSNAKRLEILNAIVDREASVTELTNLLKVRKANVSQHLTLLRYVGLVTTRRQGKNIYYRIVHPDVVKFCDVLKELHDQKKLRTSISI